MLASCAFSHSNALQSSLAAVEKHNDELRMQNETLKQKVKAANTEIARLRAQTGKHGTSPDSEPIDKLWIRISFKSGDSSLLPETRKMLSVFAQKFIINSQHMHLLILGYSDGEPIGGYGHVHKSSHGFKTLNDLSKARADAVASVMIQAGVAADKIESKGMGAADFIADNSTQLGRAKNRRVDIHLMKD